MSQTRKRPHATSHNADSGAPRFSKRGRKVHGDYFMPAATDIIGLSHQESVELRVDKVRESTKEAGFGSIFDAALEAARLALQHDRHGERRAELREFINSGGVNALYGMGHSVRVPSDKQLQHTQRVVDIATEIYQKEWQSLVKNHALRLTSADFSPHFVSSFSFSNIYESIRRSAPFLLALIESFAPDAKPNTLESDDNRARRVQRHAIVSITALLSGRGPNAVQNFFSYYLFASRVPKRVFTILNNLGISTSYRTLLRILSQQATEMKQLLAAVGARCQAIQISLDNVNWLNDIRYQRLHNQASMSSAIAAFVLIPPKVQPMFPRSEINLDAAKDLTLKDFMPSLQSQGILRKAFASMIFEVVNNFVDALNLPPLLINVPPPVVSPLNAALRPEIYTLPLYNLNESVMDEMIEVLYQIQKDIGLSTKQIQDNIILYNGDYLTSRNARFLLSTPLYVSDRMLMIRKAVLRQSYCSPKARLNYIECVPGLLHMQMAVLLLLFRTHFGEDSDIVSLSRWIKEFDRSESKLWDKSSAQVKNFNACLDFFDIVLDGYILAVFANASGCLTLGDLSRNIGAINVAERVNELTDFLIKFDIVDLNRRKNTQDTVYDNLILFLQHGLTLRNFTSAIRCGDPGQYLASLSYFTVCFQGSRQCNYANETIHLTAMLNKCWSGRVRKFYLENSLINLSGRSEGWLPCDAINERVVREAKAMRVNNSNPATDDHWRNTIGVQTMLLPDVKEKMAEECGTYISDYHSTPVEKMTDVRAIAAILLKDGVCTQRPKRKVLGGKQSKMTDLFVQGQLALATTKKITEFKRRIVSGKLVEKETLDDDRVALEADDSEGGIFWKGDTGLDNGEPDEDETFS